MSQNDRTELIWGLWAFTTGLLALLFISAAVQGELTPGHIFLAIVLLGLAVIGTPFLLGDENTAKGKAKRQSIDSLLQDMNYEDYIKLKQRLSNDAVREETVADYMSDDGELVSRSKVN